MRSPVTLSIIGLILITTPASGLMVVSTLTIQEDFVRQIGGDAVETRSLITGLENPHTYEIRPEDVEAVNQADILLVMGQTSLEPWIEDLLEGTDNPDLVVVDCSQNVSLKEDPSLGKMNPHYWMDPCNAKIMVETIRDAMIRVDPSNARQYRINTATYLSELDNMTARLIPRFTRYSGMKVIESHAALFYLIEWMGLVKVDTIEKVEGGEVSAREVEAIIEEIEKKDVRVILKIPQFRSPVVDQIQKETGVEVVEVTPLLGPFGLEHYIDMIEYDVETILMGLETTSLLIRINRLERTIDDLSDQMSIIYGGIAFAIILSAVEAAFIVRMKSGGGFEGALKRREG